MTLTTVGMKAKATHNKYLKTKVDVNPKQGKKSDVIPLRLLHVKQES